jgi:predicted transcriptional regulator
MEEFAEQGVLCTRREAVEARASIERRLLREAEPVAVVFNFKNVRAVTTTFVDECIARLLSTRLAGFDNDQPLVIANARDEVRDTIDTALRRRRLLLVALGSSGLEMLGADELLAETMQTAFELRRFSVLDLATRLKLTPQAANNRLAVLVRAGALARVRVLIERGGHQFMYEVPPVILDETEIERALSRARKQAQRAQAPGKGRRRAAGAER